MRLAAPADAADHGFDVAQALSEPDKAAAPPQHHAGAVMTRRRLAARARRPRTARGAGISCTACSTTEEACAGTRAGGRHRRRADRSRQCRRRAGRPGVVRARRRRPRGRPHRRDRRARTPRRRRCCRSALARRRGVDSVEVTLKERGPRRRPDHFLPAWLTITADRAGGAPSAGLADGTRLSADRITATRASRAGASTSRRSGRRSRRTGRRCELYLRGTLPLGLRLQGGRTMDASGRTPLPVQRGDQRSGWTASGSMALSEPARKSRSPRHRARPRGTPRLVGTLRVSSFDGTPWLPDGVVPVLTRLGRDRRGGPRHRRGRR